MPNFVNINGTEYGFWRTSGGGQHGNYTTSIPGSNLHNSNDVLTWNFSDTMTLVYPSDVYSSKQYYIYFTTPNDGITRQYQFDNSFYLPAGYLLDGISEIFLFPPPFEINKWNGSNWNTTVHQFTTQKYWLSTPGSWVVSWKSSNPSPVIAPNTQIRIQLTVAFFRQSSYMSDTCPFNGSVVITCLNPTPPATAHNQIIMVIDL
jgi:hypothetical protein